MFTLLQDERGSGFYFWATAASNVPGQNERTNLNQHNGSSANRAHGATVKTAIPTHMMMNIQRHDRISGGISLKK